MQNKHLLKNLHNLIRNSSLTYMNEFIWQDIELTNEFKCAYADYLDGNKYDIEFLGATAVITTSSTKYIYVPNQWFVIASYAVEVFEELNKYKDYFKCVAEKLYKPFDAYAKYLRDSSTLMDKKEFVVCAKNVFREKCNDEKLIEESTERLWRFASDYSWWSGQKTIDRSDFHLSVILNMLNLVNVSQGYVGDIVSAYANDKKLRQLVKTIDGFTINMVDDSLISNRDYILPDTEISGNSNVSEQVVEYETIPKPEKVIIKIGETSTMKEIKCKH